MALMAFHAIKNFYDGSWEEFSFLLPYYLVYACFGEHEKEIMEIFSFPLTLSPTHLLYISIQ
jgi:hypothetical protein